MRFNIVYIYFNLVRIKRPYSFIYSNIRQIFCRNFSDRNQIEFEEEYV